ncbi:hypothetical protein ACP275_12G093800 [Erythranthe tilingii]
MGDGEGSKNISRTAGVENLSLGISSNMSSASRDLLKRFMGVASQYDAVKVEAAEDEEEEGIELNLGLSLGGRFGVDKYTKLSRSSSIASCLPVVRDDSDAAAPPPPAAAYAGLSRSSSLPVETEEEWRKRKELQTLRRMEAKRRRSEKQRNSKSSEKEGGSLSLEEKREIEMSLRGRLEREKSSSLSSVKRPGSSSGGSQFGSSTTTTWAAAAAAANQAIIRSGIDAAMAKGKGSCVNVGKMQGLIRKQGSIGSVESKGGSSSSVSDLESKTLQGSSGEVSPASIQSMQESANPDTRSSTTNARGNTSKAAGPDKDSSTLKKPEASRTRGKEIGTNSLEEMPCVFTKGDGPNGRRVEGILYRYGKGEEVRIMCVCHGSFHSPAEFVRHAGGTDVDNPLKHIVVNPNSSSMV